MSTWHRHVGNIMTIIWTDNNNNNNNTTFTVPKKWCFEASVTLNYVPGTFCPPPGDFLLPLRSRSSLRSLPPLTESITLGLSSKLNITGSSLSALQLPNRVSLDRVWTEERARRIIQTTHTDVSVPHSTPVSTAVSNHNSNLNVKLIHATRLVRIHAITVISLVLVFYLWTVKCAYAYSTC